MFTLRIQTMINWSFLETAPFALPFAWRAFFFLRHPIKETTHAIHQ
jgi:hypothetical protein